MMKKMKKNIRLICTILLSAGLLSSCEDFFDETSSSKFDNEFVFSTEVGVYKALLNVYTNAAHGHALTDRVTMNMNAVGSDIEIRPDFGNGGGRTAQQHFYPNGTSDFLTADGAQAWVQLYKTINSANEVISGIEEVHPEVLNPQVATNITQMYGEALVLRALMYYELTRNFGDVPLMLSPSRAGMDFYIAATDRWTILDKMIEDVERIVPYMFWASELAEKTERISKGFAYLMIAKLSLNRGGYALMPNKENPEDWGTYARDEANWRKYYEKANNALKEIVVSGKHALVTVDPRETTNNGKNGNMGNPYQYVFQNQMDYVFNSESMWEVSIAREYGGNWGYQYSRVHSGSPGSHAARAYGAIRFTPHYFYSFDPKDMRRDVTISVTGTNGGGEEKILTFGVFGDGTFQGGGYSLNKWDRTKMSNPYNLANNKEGINFVYSRYSEVLLLLAETECVLGNDPDARKYLKEVRSRAFAPGDQNEKVEQYVESLSGENLLEAIKNESMWEFGGENIRKHNLVRWGDMNREIKKAKQLFMTVADEIAEKGYYTYPNGYELADYVYIKDISDEELAAKGIKCGRTYETPDGKEYDPILSPGWRGVGEHAVFKPAGKSILAIKGMFKHLTDAEKAECLSQGYEAYPYGITYVGVNNTGYSDYVKMIWSGYVEGKPCRYLLPIPGNVIIASEYILSNYYGFANH